MIDLKQFTKDAIRTESRIKVVETDYDQLEAAMKDFIVAGRRLDELKKNIFYDKPCPDFFLNRDAKRLPLDWINPRVLHGIVGIATESTELVEALYTHVVEEKSIDGVNIMEECGDISWYESILADELGFDMEEGREKVINKLKTRYPDKFTNENAINRDLDAERKDLEGK